MAKRLGIDAAGRRAAVRRLAVDQPRPGTLRRLCRLQATSQALGQPITLALAEEALGDMIRQHSRVVRLGDIEKAVCDVFGLEPASLQSDRKSQAAEPSADVGHVAGPEAHPRGAERDRPISSAAAATAP